MGVLESVTGPRDLQGLSDDDLTLLASEIRDLLIRTVATNSGHLGPNLGVVELTLAVHRVFDSPRDRIVFDTGHQSYVHKLLTGRVESFGTLRREGGLSGYPSQEESEHDIVENSHASTALSYADGLAKAYRIRGEDRHAVAIIGDGALTGGMAWEALNNIAIAKDSRLVIVVNDNGRSYTPTIGGLATALSSLRTDPRYEHVLDAVKKRLNAVPGVGPAAYDALHAMKKGLKDALAPQGLFEDLGLKYVGPVDGHDRAAMETALAQAKRFGGPVIVHALTRKGYGYDPAERHEAEGGGGQRRRQREQHEGLGALDDDAVGGEPQGPACCTTLVGAGPALIARLCVLLVRCLLVRCPLVGRTVDLEPCHGTPMSSAAHVVCWPTAAAVDAGAYTAIGLGSHLSGTTCSVTRPTSRPARTDHG